MSSAIQQLLPPEMTWALVTMYPSEVMMMPVPTLAFSPWSATTSTVAGFTFA